MCVIFASIKICAPLVHLAVEVPFHGHVIARCYFQELTKQLLSNKNTMAHVYDAVVQAIKLGHVPFSIFMAVNLWASKSNFNLES